MDVLSKRAFHVNWLAFYYFKHALVESKRTFLQRFILENDGKSTQKKRRDRKITTTSNLSNAQLLYLFA